MDNGRQRWRIIAEALSIRPNDAETHNNLGLLLALDGHTAESLKEFEAAVQSDPAYRKLSSIWAESMRFPVSWRKRWRITSKR